MSTNSAHLLTASPWLLRFALASAVFLALSGWAVLARFPHETFLLWIIAVGSIAMAAYSGILSLYYRWKRKCDLRDQMASWMIACAVIIFNTVTIAAIVAMSRQDAFRRVLGHE